MATPLKAQMTAIKYYGGYDRTVWTVFAGQFVAQFLQAIGSPRAERPIAILGSELTGQAVAAQLTSPG